MFRVQIVLIDNILIISAIIKLAQLECTDCTLFFQALKIFLIILYRQNRELEYE